MALIKIKISLPFMFMSTTFDLTSYVWEWYALSPSLVKIGSNRQIFGSDELLWHLPNTWQFLKYKWEKDFYLWEKWSKIPTFMWKWGRVFMKWSIEFWLKYLPLIIIKTNFFIMLKSSYIRDIEFSIKVLFA